MYLKTLLSLMLISGLSSCGGGGDGDSDSLVAAVGSSSNPGVCSVTTDGVSGYEQINGGLLYSNQNFLRHLDLQTSQTQTLVPEEDNLRSISVSPTGRYVAYTTEVSRSTLSIVDLKTGSDIPVSTEARGIWAWSTNERYYIAFSPQGLIRGDITNDVALELEPTNARRVFWSSDSRFVLFAHEEKLTLLTSDGTHYADVVPESGRTIRYSTVSFSPNGQFVTYVDSERTLMLYDVQRRSNTVIFNFKRDNARQHLWAPTSEYIAVADYSEERRLLMYNVVSNSLLPLSGVEEGDKLSLDQFTWAPLGNAILLATHNDDVEEMLYVADMDTGGIARKVSPYIEPYGDVEAYAWSPNGRYVAFIVELDGTTESLLVANINDRCLIDIGPDLAAGESLLRTLKWSPSSKYIFFIHEHSYDDVSFKVSTADGTSSILLNSLMLTNSNTDILDNAWHPSSDALYYEKRVDRTTTSIGSLNLIEISSQQKITVNSDGSHRFGRLTFLIPE